MIDTLEFKTDYLNGLKDTLRDTKKNAIVSKLANRSKAYYEDQDLTIIRGKFRNFNVRISGHTMRFSGSLAKYYQGQNVTMLSHEGISLALKSLQRDLGIPLGNAIVTRLDVSTVFPMNLKPKRYQELLIGIHPHKVQQDRNTYHISRTNTKVVTYDKIKEINPAFRGHFSKLYGSPNLLRFELRFINNLNDELNGEKPLKLAYLHSSSFLKRAAWKFVDHYASIEKKHIEIIRGVKSWSEFKDYVFFEWFKSNALNGGVQDILDVFNMINRTGKENGWNHQNMRNAREATKKILGEGKFLEKHSLINELDNKVLYSDLVREYILK